MDLRSYVEAISASTNPITEKLQPGSPLLSLKLRRSARLPVLAALRQKMDVPILLLTNRTDHALVLADELGMWAPEVPHVLFPEPTSLFYEEASWGMATRRDRLAVLTLLASYHIPGAIKPAVSPLIVAPIRAVMTRTLPRRDFLKGTKILKTGQVVQPGELMRSWSSLDYERVNTVVGPGQYARRGGILDLWPPAEPQPVRIEFFGDEVETLKYFDPATQRTGQLVERLQITPARELIIDPALVEQAGKLAGKNLPAEAGFTEFHIPIFHPQPSGILDYLPRQALVLFDDYAVVRDTALELEEQAVGLRKDYVKEGILAEDFPVPYLNWSEIQDVLPGERLLNLGGELGLEGESEGDGFTLSDQFAAEPRFGGRMKSALEHLVQICTRGEQVVIVSRQRQRLEELWGEQRSLTNGVPCDPIFIEGSLSEGWMFSPQPGQVYHLLTDGEIFGWRRPEPRQRHRPTAEVPEAAYADLQAGDWVVHIDHGIGKFIDLVQRTVDGLEREYLCIEYAEGDQLFVPVYQADRLTRYVGPEGREPTPTRLGSPEWRNTKSQVKEAVQEVAQDLLELYAKRQIVEGYTFGKDGPWQQELEASFPYMETEDQLRVIGEVKSDMEASRPMDRLICGDVGYGKTEVALRAAFKAVLDGKQVAILVPTTVLAQQHYNTFRERLSPFPVVVEMLSRFRTPQQQREILQHLEQGSIDIIIGTHRLLQGDVKVKDLGLLIIDEEQRFGVTHKETLKKMRTEVDVLTMTATPIPRTLYMALTGVRDISTINTPPEERLPVVTHVGPYSPRMVRQAILRELERGGQVFFVHNRVQTIGGMRQHLEKLIPEARIAVAHGQMAENDLSVRMEQFTDGEVDILLSTSIIESGLDIPNANTLIVDRADTFGLAQLYQLRGRVGRGAQRAYAYFFRHGKKLPTLEGRERLETIAENTQLGAGFSIAMRDLEIRGTGDILGTRQHGHIAAVGFHLYTRLLADAVRRIRIVSQQVLSEAVETPPALELGPEIRLPVTVDLPLHLGIPLEYVADRDSRLRIYRRIADLRSLQDVDALLEEFGDRFGPPPESVKNLLFQLKVKLLAEKAGLVSVAVENGQIVMRYPALPEGALPRAIPAVFPEIRTGRNGLWMPFNREGNWQQRLFEVLEGLNS
jgi:transcription-repair coupling factor (superfamily II helicase)